LNFGHLYFDIVSNFVLRISYFACLGIFTLVKKSLQISSFLTNKAKFRKSQMNVTSFQAVDYENNSNWTLGANEPKTNSIKANSNPIKANKMPKQTQCEPNQTQFQRQKSNWGGNDGIEQSAIPHTNVSNICRLTIEIIGSTLL